MVHAFNAGDLEPLSMSSGDFDQDGIPDLVVGYGWKDRGVLGVHPGNPDAIYPNSQAARERKRQRRFTHSPFLQDARLLAMKVRPDFVSSGDINADGSIDIALAQRETPQNRRFIHPNLTFGLMDATLSGDEMSSELSAFVSREYRDTEHFQRTGLTSWGKIKVYWNQPRNGFRYVIHDPQSVGLTHPAYIPGPNENLRDPDWDIGASMQVIDHTMTRGGRNVLARVKQGVTPQPNVEVYLRKGTGQTIAMGLTAANDITSRDLGVLPGQIRVIGIETAEFAFARLVKNGRYYYANVGLGAGKQLDEEIILNLEPAAEGLQLMSSLTFSDEGRLSYKVKSPSSFGSGLQVDWTDGDLSSNLILNRFDDGYTAGFPDGSKPDGMLWLKTGGKATPIVFPQPVTVVVADSAQHVSSQDNDVVVVHEDNPNASLTWAFYRTTRLKCGPDFLTRSNGSAHLHL